MAKNPLASSQAKPQPDQPRDTNYLASHFTWDQADESPHSLCQDPQTHNEATASHKDGGDRPDPNTARGARNPSGSQGKSPVNKPETVAVDIAMTPSNLLPEKEGTRPRPLSERFKGILTRKNADDDVGHSKQDTKGQNLSDGADDPGTQASIYGQEFRDSCRLVPTPDTPPQLPQPALYIVAVHDLGETNPWLYRPGHHEPGEQSGGSLGRRETDPETDYGQVLSGDSELSNPPGRKSQMDANASSTSGPLSNENNPAAPANNLINQLPQNDGGATRDLTGEPKLKLTPQNLAKLNALISKEGSELASHQSTELDAAARKTVQWLEDPDMLPSVIPRARVLKYMYPDRHPAEKNWETYVRHVATQLLQRLDECRMTQADRETPILYIGHGVGGLVLQQATYLSAVHGPLHNIGIGYIFLNTPFPEHSVNSPKRTHKRARYGVFPSNQCVRHRGLFEEIKTYRCGFENGILWQRFVDAIGEDVQQLPVAWLYRTSKKPSTVLPFPQSMFFSHSGLRSSRFSGCDDRSYQWVVTQIKSLITLQTSKTIKLLELLKIVLEGPDLPKSVHDGKGRSPLHLAASYLNPEAVKLLIAEARADRIQIQNKDLDGQTPLHAAVAAAVKLKPDQDRASCEEIIKMLVRSISNISQRDNKGLTAWDYIDSGDGDHGWILKLRSASRWDKEDDIRLKPFGSPNDTQKRACSGSEAIAAEFHVASHGRRIHCNASTPNVYHLLYAVGPHKVLLPTRPVDAGKIAFKWIHFPANNITYAGSQPDTWPAAHSQFLPTAATTQKSEQRALVLFMPILAFETIERLEKLSKSTQELSLGRKVEDDNIQLELARGYLKNGILHPRRPLDQFSYTSRGEEQIMPTLGWHTKEDQHAAALMVDQLWLWILHDGTVVTCFPDTWHTTADYNLKSILHELILKASRFNTLEELVAAIISNSVDFFGRRGPQGATFVGCFQRAINRVARDQTRLFNNFKNSAHMINDESIPFSERTGAIKDLLNFEEESGLLMHIRDIQDELNIVKSIVEQQKGVIEQFARAISMFYNSSTEQQTRGRHTSGNVGRLPPGKERKAVHFHDTQKHSLGTGPDHKEPNNEESSGSELQYILQGSINTRVDDNIRVVRGMLDYAARIEHSLDHLLDLKQKQANALEARFAREGSDQTRRQGNSALTDYAVLDNHHYCLLGISFAVITPLLAIGIVLRFPPSEIRKALDVKKSKSQEKTTRPTDHAVRSDVGSKDIILVIEEDASADNDGDSNGIFSYNDYYTYSRSLEAYRKPAGPFVAIRDVWHRHCSSPAKNQHIWSQFGDVLSKMFFWRKNAIDQISSPASLSDRRTVQYTSSNEPFRFDDVPAHDCARERVSNFLSLLPSEAARSGSDFASRTSGFPDVVIVQEDSSATSRRSGSSEDTGPTRARLVSNRAVSLFPFFRMRPRRHCAPRPDPEAGGGLNGSSLSS
ncbi:hypothetical protein BBP40_001334 [Aspergillus hancockii]|nr:hypothetical protein BBP40_001334 [Aspergillus hancockii]